MSPIIVEAEVVVNDLLVPADVEADDLRVNAELEGETRPMPSITIGEVQEGEEAAATMTGTYAFPVLNLVLPRGQQGVKGDPGPQGPQGPPGPVQSVNGQTGEVVLSASDVGALPDSYTAPVSSVNSKTGAVTLSAADVGAIPDTTTFALGYDPDCSVGLAEVGDAVTDEPLYTPTGTVTGSVTTRQETFMSNGTVMLTGTYSNYKLRLGATFTPTTTTENIVTGIGDLTFTGNGVKFAVEQEN